MMYAVGYISKHLIMFDLPTTCTYSMEIYDSQLCSGCTFFEEYYIGILNVEVVICYLFLQNTGQARLDVGPPA